MGTRRDDRVVPVARPATVTLRRRLAAVTCALALCAVARATAAERYALIVTGASGGPAYAEKYDTWRTALVKALVESHGYPVNHIETLAERPSAGEGVANREGVRTAMASLRARATADDLVLVLLIGHGASVDGDSAKFNLAGPDFSAREWAELIAPIAAHVVFVNTASGSFPYLEHLAGRRRIVITANDNAAQQFETVMPQYFLEALTADEADTDKNGKLSIWEAFAYASDGVKRWFEERGQLPTERPLLDDTGDGTGREAGAPGDDGFIAQVTYLKADPPIPDSGNPEIDQLRRRRQTIETELDALRVRKQTMTPGQYEDALERLLIELAMIDRTIRRGSQ